MNKYQKALETLKKIPNRIPLKSFTDDVVKEVDEAFVTLQELVDKTIPKKAIEEKRLMELRYYCPTCESFIGINEMVNNYCSKCGQLIDWSDEK